VVPKVELGTSEFGMVMVNGLFLGEFLHCGNEKKTACKCYEGLFGIFLANFAIFPGQFVKSCHA